MNAIERIIQFSLVIIVFVFCWYMSKLFLDAVGISTGNTIGDLIIRAASSLGVVVVLYVAVGRFLKK